MERDATSSVKTLISGLENDELVGSEIDIEYDMLPCLLSSLERFRRALRRPNTVITEVCIDVGNASDVLVSLEEFARLGEVFATLESLEAMVLWVGHSHSRTDYDNLTAAAALLRQTTQIRIFTLSVIDRSLDQQEEHGFDARVYAEALIHLQSLDLLFLEGLSPEESGLITTAFSSLSNLGLLIMGSEGLSTDGSIGDGVDLRTILHDEALQRVLQLESLHTLQLNRCILSERNLLTISNFLSSGSCLTKLILNYCQLSEKGYETLSEALKHSRTLIELEFSGLSPGDAFFQPLKDSLFHNKSLEYLHVGDDLSEQSATDLVAAVRSNYSLVSVNFNDRASSTNGIDENQASILRCIPRLNLAGRRYLVEDPTYSFEKGVHVLMEVKEDLDSLFVHLQENPLLCTELLRRVVLSSDGNRGGSAVDQEEE